MGYVHHWIFVFFDQCLKLALSNGPFSVGALSQSSLKTETSSFQNFTFLQISEILNEVQKTETKKFHPGFADMFLIYFHTNFK